MRNDPKGFYDRFTTITRGVNSGVVPTLLPRNQFAWAVNTTFRGFFPRSRPGWTKRTLKFLNADGTTNTTLRDNFQDNIFQGAIAFERKGQIVMMIGGRLFRIRLDQWDVLDISTSDLNANNRYRAWFAEAEDFIIAQDGQSQPWIYDGGLNRRSDTFGLDTGIKEVPVGTAMVYSQGRLIVVLADQQQFVVGDIVGGDTGTPQYGYRDAILKFSENDIINEGGAFSVSANAGKITAVRPVAQVDTSTGQGPTQVFTSQAIFSLNAPTDRTIWKDVDFPLGTVSMLSSGALSDRATNNVNGDIWTRALDGIRSFVVARRDFGMWVNTPLSQEVNRALDRDDKELLSFSSNCLFSNRLLTTVRPYRNWGHGICHQGMAVIDFAPAAFLGERFPPVWEGLWTGLQVLQVFSGTFNGIERGFVFALNDNDEIELWEMTASDTADFDGAADVPIQWSIETGGYTFPEQGQETSFGLLRMDQGWLYVDQINGSVNFTTQYRADQDACWRDWHSWEICSTNTLCGTPGSTECVVPQNYQQQYRAPFNLPTPAEIDDTVTGKPLNVGTEFQMRLSITGACRLSRFEMVAHWQEENATELCAASESCASVACCPPDDFAYSIT